MRQWWLFLSIAIAGQAYGACEPVDLRTLIGPPMDQGDSGHCFAHSSSSLIQAKLGFRVSPMQLATNYILANPDELSGAAPPAVKARITPELIKYWRDDRSGEPANFLPENILGLKGLIDTGGEELPTLLAANFLGLCPEARLPTGSTVYKKYLASIRAFHKNREIPPGEGEREIGEVNHPAARSMAWSFRRWVEERCGSMSQPALPLLPGVVSLAPSLEAFRKKQQLITAAARNNVYAAIDAALDRDQPLSIGYALADLMPEKSTAGLAEVDHASVIAGRKRVGGQCLYFLRNSFGASREGYHPKFKGRLESGGVWLRLEEIPSLYNAVWLE